MEEIETILWELVSEYRISEIIAPPSEYEKIFVRKFVSRIEAKYRADFAEVDMEW